MRRAFIKIVLLVFATAGFPALAADEAGIEPVGTTPGRDTAERFVASPDGQKIIAEYGRNKFGEGLYNDAAYARQYDQ